MLLNMHNIFVGKFLCRPILKMKFFTSKMKCYTSRLYKVQLKCVHRDMCYNDCVLCAGVDADIQTLSLHQWITAVHTHEDMPACQRHWCVDIHEHFFILPSHTCWVCCIALLCCLFDLACFFLPSHLSL